MENQTEIILNPINTIDINSRLEILVYDTVTSERATQVFTFVTNRVNAGQVSIEANTSATLNNLITTFSLDTPYLFKAEVQQNNVTKISILNPLLSISNVNSLNPITNLPIFNSQIIVTPISVFKINSVEIMAADFVACSQVKVRVTTSQPMTSFCRNLLCQSINSNVAEFITLRGSQLLFKAIKDNLSVSQNILIPTLLNEPEISVFNTPFGATVTASIQNSIGLNLQYSLDNINWQNDNVFSGLTIGNYTLYVKDQLGCSESKVFSVLESSFGVKPYVFISKENSFRFKQPNSDYLTDENQFFNQSSNDINYCFIQDFLNTDIIKTQFKSNYANIEVFVTDIKTNAVTQLPIIKKTNNIDIKQKLTQCKKYKIDNTQFGIYFESGNIIDFDSNLPLDSYDLNGSLPIWAKLGNYISINGAFYQINSIGFDESVNSEVLIFNGFMSNIEDEVIVSCIYNLQNYEVYEFEINFSEYLNSCIQIEIRNADSNYGEFNLLSENICSNDNLNNYLEIRYYNSTNTNVVYSTEIQHLLRIPYNKIKAVDSDSNENYNTDTNTYLLGSKIYEITEFDFMPLPLELWRKLKLALSVDTIFINGVGYSKNAEFTKETLGSSNLYKVTAQLIKNGFVFNSNMNSNEIIIENPVTNIPGLIENNNFGYIEY